MEIREIVESEILVPVSPYQLAKLISKMGLKTIPPQMMYNYVSKKLLRTSRNELGHLVVSRQDACEFAVKFLTKQLEKSLEQVEV